MKRFVKITRNDVSGSYIQSIEELYSAIDGELAGSEVGSKITLEVIEMTQEDYEKLPEFSGW